MNNYLYIAAAFAWLAGCAGDASSNPGNIDERSSMLHGADEAARSDSPAINRHAPARDLNQSGAAAATSCMWDDDCRTSSEYCENCECGALPKWAPDAKCGHPSSCLVDPCQTKRAVCSSGMCELADDSAQ